MHLNGRVLGFVGNHRGWLLTSVVCGWLGGVVTVIQAWLLAHVIAEVFLGGADRAAVMPTLWWLLAAIVVRSVLGWVADAMAIRAAGGVKHEIRSRVFGRLMDRGPVAAGRERTGELVTLLTDGVEALDAYVAQYLPQLVLAGVIPLTVAAVVLTRDPLSGVVLILTAPLIPVFMYLIGRMADARSRRQWLDLSRMAAFFLDTIQGLATLKILGRSRAQIEALSEIGDAFRSSSMAVLRIAFLSALVLELVATLSVAVVAVEIGLRLLGGRLEFEAAFFVLLLAPEFYLPMRRLGAAFHAGIAGVSAAARLSELLDGDIEGGASSEIRRMPDHPMVELDRVSFAYLVDGGEPRRALSDVSLSIGRGETVALVGPSGAGKSTVASLLLRFIEPDHGRLAADGVDAAEIDRAVWRRWLAWVPQHPHLFAGSIIDNLRLARADATDDKIAGALRRARVDEFVADLPDGLDTIVGERGLRLSGGQMRRIALARAFLADARMIVLDEPSEDLDPRLRIELDASLAELLEGRSALIIAHRLSTARAADRVVVMDDGRVVDQGPHAVLLERCDLYRDLVGASEGVA